MLAVGLRHILGPSEILKGIVMGYSYFVLLRLNMGSLRDVVGRLTTIGSIAISIPTQESDSMLFDFAVRKDIKIYVLTMVTKVISTISS